MAAARSPISDAMTSSSSVAWSVLLADVDTPTGSNGHYPRARTANGTEEPGLRNSAFPWPRAMQGSRKTRAVQSRADSCRSQRRRTGMTVSTRTSTPTTPTTRTTRTTSATSARSRDDLQDATARVHAERDAHTDALFAELRLVDEPDSPEGRRIVEEIFALHVDLCDGLARRYCNRGIERDDLLQVARLALLKAIRRYRPSVGASFAGFAVPTVSGELKRHFRDHGWMVRPSRRVQELRLTLRQRKEAITHELGRTPTREELADALGVDPVAMSEAEGSDSSFRPLSIDLPSTTGEQNHVADAVCGDDPDLERLCDHVDLGRALETLPPQTRKVLHLRFVEERTQREIAGELGATQMQVSRLLGRTFKQLRAQLSEPESLAG